MGKSAAGELMAKPIYPPGAAFDVALGEPIPPKQDPPAFIAYDPNCVTPMSVPPPVRPLFFANEVERQDWREAFLTTLRAQAGAHELAEHVADEYVRALRARQKP